MDSREALMAKRLRAMIPYLEAHNPDRYRRFPPGQSAAGREYEFSPAERATAGEEVRQERIRSEKQSF